MPTNNVSLSGSGSNVSVCAGNAYQVNLAGYSSYSWTPATNISSTTIGNPLLTPSVTTTYKVTISDACNNSFTDSITVDVDSLPNVVATGTATVCEGSTVQLNVSGATSYTWSPSTTLSANNIANPIATPTASTSYIVTGTSNGCSSTDTVTITTIALPALTTSGNASICVGGQASLTATQSGGNGYSWSPATGLSATNIANPIASPSATTTYNVSTSNGICSTSQQVTVTVNPLPIASTISAMGNTTFCAGGSLMLMGNSGGTWSNGLTAADIMVSQSGSYSVVTSNSCGSATSNTINVTVNPLPTASIISAMGNTTFCVGGSVMLMGNSGGTWSNGSTASDIMVSQSGSYSVVTSNSCGSATSNTINVTVNPLPTASNHFSNGQHNFLCWWFVNVDG